MEFTPEQLNYFRIFYVINDVVAECLRTIFKQEWDNRYKTILGEWKDEPRNGMDFYNRESPRNQKRYAHALATMVNGDRAEWDCTMLFYAILVSDCIHGLNPVVQSSVDDLRKLRNEVAHMPNNRLSDKDFQMAVRTVDIAFRTLGLSTLNIQEISHQTSFPTEELSDVAQVSLLKQEMEAQKLLHQFKEKELQKKRMEVQKKEKELQELRIKFEANEKELEAKGEKPIEEVEAQLKGFKDQLDELKNDQYLPLYILARGDEAKAAYRRALETGTTSDKRVKVFLVGQDRSGKTSVGRSLKGEHFRKDESSTKGVQIGKPLKYVGAKPWKNSTEEQEMTSFQHKCALHISDHLLKVSSDVKALGKEEVREERAVASESPVDDELQGSQDWKTATKDTAELEKYSKKRQEANRQDNIPEKIRILATKNLSKKKPVDDEKIWPVILDFAGQTIYRAIHPLFTSREAIYVLMLDLTKKLSATAQCFVKEPKCNEVEIQGPDSNDTNLDHIMRWMDLVHSYKHVDSDEILPPVILVGTHADLLEGDPSVKMKCVEDVKEKICDSTRDFSEHMGKTFAVNNTLAGKELDEEDPQIVSLREEILKVGDVMPHTKMEVPLRWLQVEDEVYDLASKGTNYITRQDFKGDICDEICQFEIESDFEVLLNFLHDRGTVVYHGCANDPDSLVVLNPKWLVDMLCQIITVEKQNGEKTHLRNLRKDLGKRGILHPDLLDDACERLKLADIKKALLAIMKKFNLLCEYTCKGGYSIYLVPCMLTSKADDELLSTFGNQDPAPAYITFNTQYVPGGLFSRLVVLFVEFAERRIACDQPKLCANFARFFIGEFTGLDFVCYKRVIKVRVWDHNCANSNPVEKEPDVCSEVLSFLMISLTRLHEDCHWLRTVSWDLCARCDLCPPEFVTEKGECVWHGKQGCLHDDCAHFVSLTRKPVRCARTDGPIYRPPKTWIQVLEEITGHKQPSLQTLCAKLTQMEVAPAEEQSSTMGSKKRASHQKTQSITPVKVSLTGLPEQIFQTPQQIQHNASKVNTKTDLSVELKKIASDRGYMISDNQGSGNCMFHSLSEQLYLVKGIEISYKELRQSIVQYLRKNQQKVDGTDLFNFVDGYRSWDDYLTNMEQDGTWGDHVILYATANCYETCIHVISSLPHHGDLTIRPDRPVDSTKPLVLGHVHELHYVSLQPMQGAPAKERCYTVGSKREALDQSIPSVTPVKVPRLGSECQEPNQDTQSVTAPEKVAPPGTILKEYTVITDDLERLSLSVGNNWVNLGRRLKIDQALLDSIQVDPRWPGLAEKAFQMLLCWKEANGSDATYQVLCIALCHEFVSRRDLAEKICFREVQS